MFDEIKRFGFLYWLGRFLLRNHLLLFNKMKVTGLENVPMDGPLICACNHISHLDPPAVGSALPRKSHFIAKAELFDQFFLSWYLNAIGMIPIKRGGGAKAMLENAVEVLNSGKLVTFFPEGTRSRTGKPGQPRSGVIVLAALTNAPILPVRISGSYDAMPPGRLLPGFSQIQVAFGEPIVWKPGELDHNNRDQMMSEASRLFEIILSLPGWFPSKAKVNEKDTKSNESDI